jgi:ubiquinone/menaquinone biosynthesis C-methylase UbiE
MDGDHTTGDKVMSIKLCIVRFLYWYKGLFEDPADLFTALGVEEIDKILEIGCAIGYHTIPLSQIARRGKVYAVDIWEEGLAYLESRIEPDQDIEIVRCSADILEFPPSSLDKVICFDTLHDIPEPGNALDVWAGFLKQGGEFLYRDPSISPEKVQAYTEGILHYVRTVEGVNVFQRSTNAASS